MVRLPRTFTCPGLPTDDKHRPGPTAYANTQTPLLLATICFLACLCLVHMMPNNWFDRFLFHWMDETDLFGVLWRQISALGHVDGWGNKAPFHEGEFEVFWYDRAGSICFQWFQSRSGKTNNPPHHTQMGGTRNSGFVMGPRRAWTVEGCWRDPCPPQGYGWWLQMVGAIRQTRCKGGVRGWHLGQLECQSIGGIQTLVGHIRNMVPCYPV